MNKALRIMLFTNSLILIAAAMLGPIYALFVQRIGGDLMDASIASGVFAIVAGTVTYVSGKYSDKVKENELIIVLGYTVMSLGFLSYIWVKSIILLFIVQAIIGLGEAIYSPAFDAIYSKHLDGKKSGMEWGSWESMNYIAAAFGAILGGITVTFFGFNTLFVIMSLLCLFSALYIYKLNRDIL